MSSSSLSLTKAKEIAINFIKKYKDLLRDGESCQLITDADIARYEAKTPSDFFDLNTVKTNFGDYFDLFDLRYNKSCNTAQLWIGKHSNINDLMKNITKNSESYEDLLNFWQMEGCWYNFTEARMKALEKIFDQLGAKLKTKTAKKLEVVTISDTTEVQNGIAFIDFDADKFEHALKTGGDNFDPWINDASENSAKNQIDHAINAFKLAKKELDVFLTELVKAKDAGAKYVVDASYTTRNEFRFGK